MEAIERVKAHFAGFGVGKVEVPEWGENDEPLVVYFKPMTLAEKQKLATIGEREGYVSRLADALIMKALDAQGKPLFTIAHKQVFRYQADPEVLARVVTAIMAGPTREDMEKNSDRTSS